MMMVRILRTYFIVIIITVHCHSHIMITMLRIYNPIPLPFDVEVVVCRMNTIAAGIYQALHGINQCG